MSAGNPFAERYVDERRRRHIVPPIRPGDVKVRYSQDLAGDLKAWENDGYKRIGSAEFVDRGNRMGISREASAQGAAVGASLVIFQATPAKLRAIRRDASGAIDMSPVLADPPTSASPRGYYVIHAVFLAQCATDA